MKETGGDQFHIDIRLKKGYGDKLRALAWENKTTFGKVIQALLEYYEEHEKQEEVKNEKAKSTGETK
jgi:thymidylate synthase ThyX